VDYRADASELACSRQAGVHGACGADLLQPGQRANTRSRRVTVWYGTGTMPGQVVAGHRAATRYLPMRNWLTSRNPEANPASL
jgi:hypothetical protein